jgi:hypothetical protein
MIDLPPVRDFPIANLPDDAVGVKTPPLAQYRDIAVPLSGSRNAACSHDAAAFLPDQLPVFAVFEIFMPVHHQSLFSRVAAAHFPHKPLVLKDIKVFLPAGQPRIFVPYSGFRNAARSHGAAVRPPDKLPVFKAVEVFLPAHQPRSSTTKMGVPFWNNTHITPGSTFCFNTQDDASKSLLNSLTFLPSFSTQNSISEPPYRAMVDERQAIYLRPVQLIANLRPIFFFNQEHALAILPLTHRFVVHVIIPCYFAELYFFVQNRLYADNLAEYRGIAHTNINLHFFPGAEKLKGFCERDIAGTAV